MLVLAAASDWIRDAVAAGSYPLLAGLIALENLFPPIPSEVILPLAGFYVAEGELSFLPAVIATTIGSVVGALVLYAVGRFGGRPFLERFGPRMGLSKRSLDRGDRWFDERGDLIVLFGRLIPGVRSVVSVPAGLAEMPIARFVILTTLGSALWNSLLIGAGLALGDSWERVSTVVGPLTYVAIATVLVLVGWLVLKHRMRARRAT